MSAGILIFDIFAAFVLAAVILYRYGDWYRHHIIVTLAVLVAWCFSFLIIFVLPLDVSSVSSYLNFCKNLVEFVLYRLCIGNANNGTIYHSRRFQTKTARRRVSPRGAIFRTALFPACGGSFIGLPSF